MEEEFKIGDEVHIVKGTDKSKSGKIVGKGRMPWKIWEEVAGKEVTFEEQQNPMWEVRLDDTDEIVSFFEYFLEHI